MLPVRDSRAYLNDCGRALDNKTRALFFCRVALYSARVLNGFSG